MIISGCENPRFCFDSHRFLDRASKIKTWDRYRVECLYNKIK